MVWKGSGAVLPFDRVFAFVCLTSSIDVILWSSCFAGMENRQLDISIRFDRFSVVSLSFSQFQSVSVNFNQFQPILINSKQFDSVKSVRIIDNRKVSTTHKSVPKPLGFKSQVLGTIKTRNFGAPRMLVPVWVVLWHPKGSKWQVLGTFEHEKFWCKTRNFGNL